MKINVLLCDDDKDFLQRLTETVTKQPRPAGTSIAITRNLHSASLSDRDLSRYQIMFLDIDMAERSGMDIARRVRALHLDTIIIFVTNYPQFSLEGTKFGLFVICSNRNGTKTACVFPRCSGRGFAWGERVAIFCHAESYYVPYSDIIYLAAING